MSTSPSPVRERSALIGRYGRPVLLFLAGASAVAADFAVIAGFVAGDLTLPLALAAHAGVAIVVFVALTHWLHEIPAASLMTLWVAFLGPLGAVAATFAIIASGAAANRRIGDEEWFARLSGSIEPDTDLVRALKDRRAYQTGNVALHSFRQIMDKGTVAQKQTILGLIAQSYEPALSGLLMEALRSPEVAVRASAAAVLARLRDKQAAELKTAIVLADSPHHDDVLQAANLWAKAAASGLMPPAESHKALTKAASLRQRLKQHDVVPLAVHQLDDRLKRAAEKRRAEKSDPARATPMMPTMASGSPTRRPAP